MRHLYFLVISVVLTCTAQAQQVSDFDGNLYNTVLIGNQQWLVENLRSTHFSDGRPIPIVTDDSLWIRRATAAMCWYDNDSMQHLFSLGGLYNGFAARDTAICPTGWSVPFSEDWDSLITFLGGSATAGGAMKHSSTEFWEAPNLGATNSSGFSALPSGWRSQTNGSFAHKGFRAGWFSLMRNNALEFRWVSWSIADAGIGPIQPVAGMSIRCFRPAPSSQSSVAEPLLLQLKLYPNPSKGQLSLHLSEALQPGMRVQLQDLNGKWLGSFELESEEQQLDLSAYPDAVYLISLWHNDRPLHYQRLLLRR